MRKTHNKHATKRHSSLTAISAAVVFFGALGVVPVYADSPVAVAGESGEQADIDGNTAEVTVSGLTVGSTVKLYQIADGYYKDGKLVKYVLMDPTNAPIAGIGDNAKGQTDGTNDIITEAEVTNIANNIRDKKFTADAGIAMTVTTNADGQKATASASVEPGMYIAIAEDSTHGTLYNPIILAVNVTDVNNGTTAGGNVAVDSFFKEGSRNAYAKASTLNVTSKIVSSTKAAVIAEGETAGTQAAKTEHGDIVAIGDTVNFEITDMSIPSYSDAYKNPAFGIRIELSEGFDALSNLVVNVGGTPAVRGTDYTVATATHPQADKSMPTETTITFSRSFIKNLRGKTADERAVDITYSAALNSKAMMNYAENYDRVAVTQTTGTNGATTTTYKNNFIYTFGIGSQVDKQAEGIAQISQGFAMPNFVKVGPGGSASVISGWTTVTNPLSGAEFTLYSDEACTTVAKTGIQTDGTAPSDTEAMNGVNIGGNIVFSGLDEGTYYMKETKAPTGYGLADQTYKFVISSTMDSTTGIMSGYTVQVFYKDALHTDWTAANTAAYTAASSTVNGTETPNISYKITRTDAPTVITDVKLQSMPSTGGRGLILIIAIAAGMGVVGFVIDRKKKQEEHSDKE